MSPAGYFPQMKAAIEAGADAVYFGLQHFSARAKVGFRLEELPEAMSMLHHRGVKGFLTFNTLVFDHELESAITAIEAIGNSGVDAVIVQDIGIAKLIRDQAPSLEIHGSTQMSVTSAEGVELAHSLGCSRVVLGRELSLANMREIAQKTDVELEVFVHGALCVSYSGQCFSSEAWGGRSANRGKCAQACRLPYDLMVDGQRRELGEYRYLLSPGDLYALEQIPELVDIGIACVKIEGRYKSAEYVAATTKAYRQAIDSAVEGRALEQAVEIKDELEQVYSRGLGPHFISGIDHQSVVVGRAPRHRGRKAGQVVAVDFDSVVVAQDLELSPGDGVVFDAAARREISEKEEGGFIYEVTPLSETTVQLRFGHGEVDFERIQLGDWIWRTLDPKLAKRLKPFVNAESPVHTRPIEFVVVAKVGEPLQVEAVCDSNLQTSYSGPILEAAKNKSLNEAQVREQFGRLGGTPFHLGQLNLQAENVFVPLSVLNECRRALVSQLLALRAETVGSPVKLSVPNTVKGREVPASTEVALHVLVRSAEQLEPVIELAPASITLDYLELYGLRDSVERIKSAGIVARVASPRVLKPAEEKIVRFLLSLEAELVIRSGGLLHQLIQVEAKPRLIGDFSLNVANRLSAQTVLDLGVERITPTHDLNAEQIIELAASQPELYEVIAFHHLPVFHTEHCVFCRFLSEGTDSTNCGHPCEKHRIALADGQGRQHPVMADVGCRNTVFGSEAQFNAGHVKAWVDAGLCNLRIEFVHEGPEQVRQITKAFQQFLTSKSDLNEFASSVAKHSPAGVTEGSLFVPENFKQLVQLS